MNRLYSLIIMAVTIFSTAYAQTQLTVINEDTGESFEVIVPDGLKISQYNGNWLDSIPYLMENVRNKEPWAYEALAECYRYGRGVEKSITNAMIYYDESNVRARDLAEKAYESDPTDELGFMNHIMEELDKKRMTIEEAISLIDKYPAPLPKWAVRIKKIFDNKDVDDIEGYVKSLVDLDNDSADELVASIAGLKILRPNTPAITALPPSPEVMRNLTLAGKKIPILFSIAADKYWSLYEDCPNDEQAMKNAFDLYHKAYLYGFLQPRGAVEVLDYRDNNQLYEGFPFSNEEMDNLDRFYSKEYRIHFKASCVVEEYVIEEVVEYDDDPVMLESEAYK